MTLKPFLFAAALIVAQPALAHEAKGPNGGKVVDAGEYHVELVAKDANVAVFVTDGSDKPVPATGFKGTAILVVDGKPQRITLEPQGPSLTGKAAVALPAEPKGAVQLTTPAGSTVQGKFN